MITVRQIAREFAGVFVDTSPRTKPPGAPSTDAVKPFALSTWLVMLGLIIFLFGFRDSSVAEIFQRKFGEHYSMKSHYASWELGALVWNAVFAIYFYCKVPLTDNRLVEKVTPLLIWLGIGGSTVLALLTLVQVNGTERAFYIFPAQHVFYVLLIGVMFLVIDGLHAWKQRDHRHRHEFQQCLLLADLPMVPAIAVLYWYQCVQGTGDFEKLQIFLSGAISFQLIASTLIFACIQAGVFTRVFGFRRPETVSAQAH